MNQLARILFLFVFYNLGLPSKLWCQEQIWTHLYPETSNNPLLTKINENTLALSGSQFSLPSGWKTFTEFYSLDGKLIHQIIWESSRFDKPIINFQSLLQDSLLFLLYENGKLLSIHTQTFKVDSSFPNMLNCLLDKEYSISQAFKNKQNLMIVGRHLKSNCMFEIRYNTQYKTFTYCEPCTPYPFNNIIAILKDRSILTARSTQRTTIIEKFTPSNKKYLFSISLDSLSPYENPITTYETNSGDVILFYQIVSASKIYSRTVRLDPTGNIIWSFYQIPEHSGSPFNIPFKYHVTMDETPHEELIFGGTTGSINVGHFGKHIISKYSKKGDLIWEIQTDLGYENDAVFAMTLDKFQNIIIAGVANLTDYETPNRIFLSKFSSQKYRDPTNTYDDIIIYPNPFIDEIRIFIPYIFKPPFKIEIFDLNGKLVFHDQVNVSMICQSLQDFNFKTLLLKITDSSDKLIIQKILIQI